MVDITGFARTLKLGELTGDPSTSSMPESNHSQYGKGSLQRSTSCQEERSNSLRRTLDSLLIKLPQEPQKSEMLLVSLLHKSVVSHSTPSSSPRRKSVIEKTPPASPIHHLSPEEPALTPKRTTNSNFVVPSLALNASPVTAQEVCSSNVISGERFGNNFPCLAGLLSDRPASSVDATTIQGHTGQFNDVTAASENNPSGEHIKGSLNCDAVPIYSLGRKMYTSEEILAQLEELEHDIAYAYRSFPSNGLDELSLKQDYEVTLSSLEVTVRTFSKAVNSLTIHHHAALGPDAVQTWKEKRSKMESDLGMYRREVRRVSAIMNNLG